MRYKYIFLIISLTLACSFITGFATASEQAKKEIKNRNLAPEIAPLKDVSIQPAFSALQIINAQKREELPPDCEAVPCLALTFDDGPSPEMAKILDVLDKRAAPATFYLIGNKVSHYSETVRRAVLAKHEIGNHSWDHADFRKLAAGQISEQINRTQSVISEFSASAMTFRPPYGFIDNRIKQQIPMPIIMWNIDPKDWYETNSDVVASHIINEAKPGAIILLHATKGATAEAINKAIPNLKTHYKLVTVSRLLGLSPDSGGYFYSR